MPTAGAFKNPRSGRAIVSETNYAKGMTFVDTPLPEGASRVLFNYDIIDNGDSVKPRGGYQWRSDTHVHVSNANQEIILTGVMYVEVGTDAALHRFVLSGQPNPTRTGYLVNTLSLMVEDVEYEGISVANRYNTAPVPVNLRANKIVDPIHQQTPLRPLMDVVAVTLNSNVYIMADNDLHQLYCKFETGVYSFTLIKVVADDITPSEAVNYGYNQLKANPYSFANKQGTALRLHGILPYDSQGNLKFSARTNEDVTFKLIYEYPVGGTYKVQWEIHDITSDASMVLLAVAQSPTYTAPAEISITTQAPYKRFSLIAKVYASTDTSVPLKVLQLGSYYLTDDQSQNARSLDLADYDLSTASGMTVWNRQVMLWGVSNAKTVLFRSMADNPRYFPYPHNVDIFDEDILAVVPYLDRLLIWTQTKLYVASMDPMGLITRKIVQGSLDMSKADAASIVIVKNMVMFRSGNYHYMVVPNTKVLEIGELSVAPVYKPVEKLMDNLHANMQTVLREAYNMEHILQTSERDWTMALVDAYSYLDNTQIRNCYIYLITTPSATMYVELRLNYDTMLRAWAISGMQTNGQRLVPLRQRVTDSLILANIYKVEAGGSGVQLISKNILDAQDTFKLDGGITTRLLKNYQFLDTGKRSIDVDIKKRFREIQFRVNNLAAIDLEFYSSFILDDDVRTGMFEYTVEQITDVNDPNYGQIYMVSNYVEPTTVIGETALGAWRLGLSQFPKLTVVKVRLPVSGKGYSGRLKLLSKNEAMYELLSHSWVLRHMNAR